MQVWGIKWELQRINFYRGSLFKFFPALLFCCIKLTLVPLWTVITSVVLGGKKKSFFFLLLLFGQKWLCYSAMLAQNALQGVSCVFVFWLINSHEICSLQPDSLALSPAVGSALPLGRSLDKAVLPIHDDYHVNKKEGEW